MLKRMSAIHQVLKCLHEEDSGQDLIEYALLATLIALGAVIGIGTVAAAINNVFSSVAGKINACVT